MTNFDFLQKSSLFQAFSDACIEAEESISTSPALCALGVRKSAELAVKWLYSIDSTLTMPYKDNLSALVFNPSFTDSVDEDTLNHLRYIIKLGNFRAKTASRSPTKRLSLPSRTFLTSFCSSTTATARSTRSAVLMSHCLLPTTTTLFQRMISRNSRRRWKNVPKNVKRWPRR